MKKLYPIIALCLVAINGCQLSTGRQQDKTQFFQRFSLYDTINRMNVPQITCSASFSTGVSGGVGEVTSFRKDSSLDCEVISPAFDESAFTSGLRTEIEQEIVNGGARVTGSGETGPNFHCEYQDGGIHGAIEVVAGRVEANKYKLTYIIREYLWK
ncbi:MAG: hypothetical protein WAU45_18640 [Blastocatellia bacterium]